MKYERKTIIIEAFRAGIDDIPEWFMDRVRWGDIVIKPDNDDYFCVMTRWNNADINIKKGDYITNSLFPFTYYDPQHFHSSFDPHHENIVKVDLDNFLGVFSTKEEVYNSLHEDIRDLRRAISSNNVNEACELLSQIAMTSLQARKDLSDDNLCRVQDDDECK